MRIVRAILGLGLLTAVLAGCSIALSNDLVSPTLFVPVIDPSSQAPTVVRPANATPFPTPIDNVQALGLSGRIVYTLGAAGIRQLNLETGQVQTVFLPPSGALLTFATTAPDESQFAIAYAPPPPAGSPQLGYTNLYLVPGDCAEQAQGCSADDLTPLLIADNSNEAYFSPVWSPDGQYLYYAHFLPSQATTGATVKYKLERVSLPAGERETLIEDALWPAISQDGTRLAFVSIAAEDGKNDLLIAEADGANQRPLVKHGAFYAVDSPVFTPDGQSIIFSAVDTAPVGQRLDSPEWVWLDRLLGVGIAEAAPLAHNVPSDWWQVSVAGGEPKRLTQIFDTGLFGDFSPDGKWLGYLSQSGIYVMAPDGARLTRLLTDRLTGTINWIP